MASFSSSIVEKALFLLISIVLISSSMAAHYTVGDDAGWTLKVKVDYPKWAASKNFQVGDTINFVYDPKYHNVMEVTHPNYRACNLNNPVTTYTTGNDTITIKKAGHFFYLCGIPGHCDAGQKVDIRVVSGPPAAPVPSGSQGHHDDASAPAPSSSSHDDHSSPSAPAPAPSSASLPYATSLFSKLAIALGFFAALAH